MRVPSPYVRRDILRIVVREVMFGNFDIQPAVDVAEIFGGEGGIVVFAVTGDVEHPAFAGSDDVHTRFLGFGEDFELRAGVDIFTAHFRMAGMGSFEDFIEASEEGVIGFEILMLENTEHFCGEGVFRDTVMEMKRRLSRPADMEGGIDVGFGPAHDFTEFVPVIHVTEFEVFDGCAGDDKAVELFVLDFLVGTVERFHMLGADVGGNVGCDAEEGQLDLEGGIGEKTDDLVFGGDLRRHEVENGNFQGTDILRGGAEFVHNEDILGLKDLRSGKSGGDFDRHIGGVLLWNFGIPNFSVGYATSSRKVEKMSSGHFFRFLCPTRTAHKGAQTPPLCELLAWKSFGGLALKGSNIQRFARIQIVRKGQGLGAELSKSFVQQKQRWRWTAIHYSLLAIR